MDGEGLPLVRPSDLLPGPVVAVNRAIVPSALWAGGTPVAPDVWTCQDSPNCSIRYFSSEVRARPWGENPPPTVWTRASRVAHFAKAYPGLKVEPQPDGKAFSERIPWESELSWCKYTVLGAITEAVMRVREVTRSTLRIGSFYDDAVKLDKKLTKKMTDEG